jgi:hypothetical protein
MNAVKSRTACQSRTKCRNQIASGGFKVSVVVSSFSGGLVKAKTFKLTPHNTLAL